ncbi:hypothetical protein [Stutzerimonas stutzeri]|uniref:Uncharacterized protein n=1 Tax=Stutzerimonas stutzeri KOS6 TaxID=1218352 RepID=A0A061JLX0_STUST|nr:hypothetical protein [Stutzerimonas stutzeri]EWC39608.1 hypothetical protein B597_019650 [Stutzerimonas stutzeri KOS6]
MTDRTYTITVTERQAAELQEACELLARIKIGQIDHAIERLPGFYDRRDLEQVHATRHEIQRLANTLMPEATKRREDGVAWDLYQVIRHRLSWDRAHDKGVIQPGEPRKWPEMMGVSYDEPLAMSGLPLATIKEIEQ